MMDYRDVTKRKEHVRRFSTNPLQPDYKSNGHKQSLNFTGFLIHDVKLEKVKKEENAAPSCNPIPSCEVNPLSKS